MDAKEGSYFGATPNDLTATAFYAYSTEILVKTARILGKDEDAEKYSRLHESILKAYRDEFFTPNGRLAAPTQTAHILSLMFGLAPEEYKERTIKGLIKLLDDNDGHLQTGFLRHTVFLSCTKSERQTQGGLRSIAEGGLSILAISGKDGELPQYGSIGMASNRMEPCGVRYGTPLIIMLMVP